MSEPVTMMAAPEPDDDVAPHGRRADGTPKPAPGTRRGGGFRARVAGGRAAGAGRGRPATPKAPRAGRPRAAVPKRPNYAERLKGLGQLIAFPLSFTRQTRPDAVAITVHWPKIAEAIDAEADDLPDWAQVALDRVAAMGPHAKLITALTPLVAQLLVNHGVQMPISVAKRSGAVPPDLLMARAAAEAHREAAEEAAQVREWAEEYQRISAELGTVEGQAQEHAA